MLDIEERTVAGLLKRAAASHGDQTYLLFEDDTFTFAEADFLSDRAAAAFAARGVGAGDRVILIMDNSPEYLWAVFGLAKLGAISVPINTQAKGALLRYYIEDSASGFAVVDARHVDAVTSATEDGSRFGIAWVSGAIEPDPGLAAEVADLRDDLRRAGPLAEQGEASCRDTTFLMYTSGTTGPSKAVTVSNGHAVTTGLIVAERFGLSAEDRMYTCLPLFHANALWYTNLAAISAGASVVLAKRFSASGFWDDIVRYRATEVNAMGSMMQILQKQDPTEAERANTLRTAFVVPFPDDPEAFEKRYGAKLATTYGLSEWVPVALSRPGEGYDKHAMAGPILEEFSEVKIVDEDDRELPTGTVGEVILRPRQPWTTFAGYYNKAEATVSAWRNLWFHTGDRARVDEDGVIYFIDRKKDAIRRRGENISAFELEEILRSCELIREVAAIPLPSEMTEDDVGIYVVAKEGHSVSEAAIYAFAEQNVPRYMLPRYIAIIDELPKTPTSRVEKYKLIEAAAADLDALWDAEDQPGAGQKTAPPA